MGENTGGMQVRMMRAGAALLAGASALALGNAAFAQSAPDAPPEIIVTAQKRSESIQHVPISLQALGPATLEAHQIASFDDYARQLPSVSFQSFGPGQSQLSFRGITSGGDGLPFGALPTAGFYLDEIPVTTIGSLLDMHIYDMARIEALSGPQGTLYGASSLSGTLRMITNKPDPAKLSGALDLTADTYGKGGAGGTIEGFVNVPLGHGVAVRAVGWYEHDGGYINNTPGSRTYNRVHTVTNPDGSTSEVASPLTVNNAPFVKNHFNDVDTAGGRVSMVFETAGGWKFTPQLIGQWQKTHGSFLYDPRLGDLQVHDFSPEYNRDQWIQAALTIEGKLSDWDVVYSGGWLGRQITNASDYSYYTVAYDALYNDTDYFQTASGANIDPTQRYYQNQAITKQTHELRVSSPAGDPFHLTAGLFMQHQTNHSYQSFYVPGLAQNVVTTWWDYPPVYGDSIFINNANIVFRDYAVFGEASYSLTDKLTLTGGLRGFISDNSLTGYSGFASNAPATCTVPLTSPDACSNIDKRTSTRGETHKINLTWQIDNDHMVYATYSTGFRPGGNNRRAGINPYAPDTLDNFELGWKTFWFDHKLRLNGAVYYERWKNLQYALVVEGSGGITNIYNAGTARVYGAELDVQVRPVRGLTLSASGAYNDAALTTNFCSIGADGNPDCSGGNIAAPAGTRLPVQPRFKLNATARYEFPLGKVDAFVQGSMLTQSNATSQLSVADNALLGNSAPFTTADFSAGGKTGAYTFQVFVQNAFDTRGSLSHNVFTAPATSGQYYRIYPVKPQYFGVKLGKSF